MNNDILIAVLLMGMIASYKLGRWQGYEKGKIYWRGVGKIEGRYRERWGKWADEDDGISSTHYTAEEMDTDVLHHKLREEK